MADENDGSGGGMFGRLNTLSLLVQAGRAALRGNLDRTALLVGIVVLGRRSKRLAYLIQVVDTVNQLRKKFGGRRSRT